MTGWRYDSVSDCSLNRIPGPGNAVGALMHGLTSAHSARVRLASASCCFPGVSEAIRCSAKVTQEEMAGSWIKLSWDRPASVTEVALCDRPNQLDNVLGGTLSFDDGVRRR
jgi:hypothetical protein